MNEDKSEEKNVGQDTEIRNKKYKEKNQNIPKYFL